MASDLQIVTGRSFRKCIDVTNKLWQKISFWSKASDVEFDDGENAETKLGAIKGITTDLNITETGYAADMTALAQLNSEIKMYCFDPTNTYETQIYLCEGTTDNFEAFMVPYNGAYIIRCYMKKGSTIALRPADSNVYAYYNCNNDEIDRDIRDIILLQKGLYKFLSNNSRNTVQLRGRTR